MENIKIGKELIEEVMNDKGTFETININKNELSTFGILDYHIFSINIYEFAFKCKEWALGKGYLIDERGVNLYILTDDGISDMYKSYGKPFCPFRVFEACEWILTQKDM